MVKNCWDMVSKDVTLLRRGYTPLSRTDWLDENISKEGIKKFFDNVEIINKIGPVTPEKNCQVLSAKAVTVGNGQVRLHFLNRNQL